MRAAAVLLLLFFVENVLHTVFPDQMFPLVLIAVIFFGFRGGMLRAALLGAWAGMLLEIFKVGSFGFAVLPLTAIGAAGSLMSSKIFRESFLAQVVLPAAAFYFFLTVNLGSLWESSFPFRILLTAFLSPLVFHGLKKSTENSPASRSTRWVV